MREQEQVRHLNKQNWNRSSQKPKGVSKEKKFPKRKADWKNTKGGFPCEITQWYHHHVTDFEKGALSCGIIHFSFKLTKNDRFVVFKTFGLRPHQTFEGSKKISKFPIWRSIVLPSEFNRYQLLYIFRFLILRSVHSHQ